MSLVIDHYADKWQKMIPPYENPWKSSPIVPTPDPVPYYPIPEPIRQIYPSPAEIQEFRELLEKARKYDRENNQPDCEMEEKKKLLLEIAKKLGIKIDFL